MEDDLTPLTSLDIVLAAFVIGVCVLVIVLFGLAVYAVRGMNGMPS